MNLVRWNPMRDMFSRRSGFNRLFDEMFFPVADNPETAELWNWNPAVDVIENDDSFVIKAELPGVDKKDISLDIKDGTLTLKGERSTEKEDKNDRYYCKERAYGSFRRDFRLPVHAEADKITADYKDGVLTVTIPRPEDRKPKQITVH
jgi:HSP20 family protein